MCYIPILPYWFQYDIPKNQKQCKCGCSLSKDSCEVCKRFMAGSQEIGIIVKCLKCDSEKSFWKFL